MSPEPRWQPTRIDAVRGVTGWLEVPLVDGWRCGAAPPTVCPTGHGHAGEVAHPAATRHTTRLPARITGSWFPATAPGTVASALAEAGLWTIDNEEDLDTHDWTFVHEFAAEPPSDDERIVLAFDGLAGSCSIWLNDTLLGTSANQFVAWSVDVTALLAAQNRLVIVCHALAANLDRRTARARWRTSLVDRHALRHARASLWGRMPGWWPRAPVIGPWRGVRLVRMRRVLLDRLSVRPTLDGDTGVVAVRLQGRALGGTTVRGATLHVGETSGSLPVATVTETARDRHHDASTWSAHGAAPTRFAFEGAVRVADAPRWWPHTHGAQPQVAVSLTLDTDLGPITVMLPSTAFREIAVDPAAGEGFGLTVNGVPVFCRGAVWLPLDVASPGSVSPRLRAELTAWRDAGANMLRVPGLAVYESTAFHALCDELGLLVWQDAMFASMDYPADDPRFVAATAPELRQAAARLACHPSTAVWCGSSEVAQQAAFLGRDPAAAVAPFFTMHVPTWLLEGGSDVPYLPSSPWGGVPPTRTDIGVTHYYGVGAYRRPVDDARRAAVSFAAECLGFSHLPDEASLDAVLRAAAPTRDLAWQRGIPRDPSASWDFEGVRDHYAAMLHAVDPAIDRVADPVGYRDRGRQVTAELLRACFTEWRRHGSPTRGALVWCAHDVRPGAGWGVRTADGTAKEAFRALASVWQPTAVLLTDEGQSGVFATVINERPTVLEARLEVAAWRADGVCERSAAPELRLLPHTSTVVSLEAVLGEFLDLAACYRFSAPRIARVTVRLCATAGSEGAASPLLATAEWPATWPLAARSVSTP